MNIIKSIEGLEVGAIAPNSIVNADCLEAMKLIPDKSIDCIIADLPFGITACHWDVVIPFEPLWEQYKRIIKPNGAICLFGSQPFTSALVMSNPKWFKYEWIWEKNLFSSPANAKRQPLKAHENILIFSKDSHSYYPQFREYGHKTKLRYPNGGTPKAGRNTKFACYRDMGEKRNSLDFCRGAYPISRLRIDGVPNCNSTRLAPTQKPVPLIEYLIKTYTQENELVLDNTAGSGTLAISAINTNRRYICIEKDEHYFEVMRNRIANHDPNAPIKPKKPKAAPKGQLALF